jgi:hypothetical protein
LAPGQPVFEFKFRDEQSEDPVILHQFSAGEFNGETARLIFSSNAGIQLGFKTPSGTIEGALPVRSGEVIALVARRQDLLAKLESAGGVLNIDGQFKRHFADSADPPAKPFKIRIKRVSEFPSGVQCKTSLIAMAAEDIDETDAPVSFARLEITNAAKLVSYDGPRVGLSIEARSDASKLDGLFSGLLLRYVRPAADKAADAWFELGTFQPIPLPLDGPLILECGLVASWVQAWLRFGDYDAASMIGLRLSIVSIEPGKVAPRGLDALTREFAVPVRVEGSPADILFWQFGNERFKTSLRSEARPLQRLPCLRSIRRGSSDSPEFGLEALVFDVWILSDGSLWAIDTELTLTDFDAEVSTGGNATSRKTLARQTLHSNGEDSKISIQIPLPALASTLKQAKCQLAHAQLEIKFLLRRQESGAGQPAEAAGEPRVMTISIPISVQQALPQWLTCIDFGASAIAVGIASGQMDRLRSSVGSMASLLLGDWFRIVDPFHPEIEQFGDTENARTGRNGRSHSSALLPSYIGLSSSSNLRALFEPASYGNLEALDEPPLRRLEMLGYEYDVSVPFPSSERISDEVGQVVFALKRDLARGTKQIDLKAPVNRMRLGALGNADVVDVGRLFGDCFHELGRFIVPRGLEYSIEQGRSANINVLRDFRRDLENGSDDHFFGAVLTHPFGLDARQLGVYREAGRRFLAGLLGRKPDTTHGSGGQEQELGMVVAVPEALAAARYGLLRLLQQNVSLPDQQRFICLDIGASTYDVTIVDAKFESMTASQPPRSWIIQEHFGLLLGGADLDVAIAQRVIEIVAAAAATPSIAARFAVECDLKPAISRIESATDASLRRKQRKFLESLQQAKKALSELLFDNPGSYCWTEGSLTLEIGTIARPGSVGDERPLAWKGLPEAFPKNDRYETQRIEGQPAELIYGRDKDGSAYVKLAIMPLAFERVMSSGTEPSKNDARRIADLTRILATRVPELAAASVADLRDNSGPVWWIVTGRAALWPMIYAGVVGVVRQSGGRILDKPFRPSEMKEAVLEGALRLAVETHLPLTTNTLPSIGVVIGDSVVQVLQAGKPAKFPVESGFHLVRVLPGFDRVGEQAAVRADFGRAGLRPWSVLGAATARSGQAEVTMYSETDGTTVAVKENGRETIYFGPYREDRIYGQEGGTHD